jgi:hypothetical protein
VQRKQPKTYNVLRALYDHFDGRAPSAEDSEQFHPNRRDAKLVMQAVYLLNDMALGVGDEAVGKEGAELLKMLEDLAKLSDSKIDVNAVKTALDKLSLETEKQRLVAEEIMPTLQQQLKKLISPQQATSQKP